MKLDIDVVVMPQPGNEGEDLNWASWMVYTHEDKDQLQQQVINAHVAAFMSIPFYDISSEEWGDLSGHELAVHFLEYMHLQGYTVFNPTRISWCVPV